MTYDRNYFLDRKLKYEKNHGKFIHEFMFAEHEGRILGQCNVALNDLQKQLDAEVTRAKAEEARLDKKIDAETTRAKAEEVRLDGKIDIESSRAKAEEERINGKIDTETNRATSEEVRLDSKIDAETSRAQGKEKELSASVANCLPKNGAYMADNALINWGHNEDDPNSEPYTLGGLRWAGATDYITIQGKITGNNNMNLIINMGDDNSNAIVFTNSDNTEVSSIHSDGEYTGTIDWERIKNRPAISKEAFINLNNNIRTLTQYYNALKARVDKLDGGAAN